MDRGAMDFLSRYRGPRLYSTGVGRATSRYSSGLAKKSTFSNICIQDFYF